MSLASYKNIYHGLSTEPGEMRITGTGLAWQGTETKSLVTVTSDSMKYLQWIRVARGFQLRIGLKNDRRETFDGFEREVHEKLSHLVKQHWDLTLESKEMSYRGYNWGEIDMQRDDLEFIVANKTAFEIPLNSIANSNIAGKAEVSLEFTTLDPENPRKKKAADEMTEMRFYIPGVVAKEKEDGDEKAEEEEEEEDEISAAQAFYDLIKKKAEIGQVTGDHLVEFNEVLLLTPRGRYDLDIFPTFLRLRGKTYDYKIMHQSVTRLFLLPKPDEIHIQLVIGLDPPIHQGQTRYPFLVMQFTRDDNIEVDLNIDEETIKEKYPGKLEMHYDAPTFQVVSNVFRALTSRKLNAPGEFKSHNGQSGVKANMKASQGDLYFLDRALIFVAKQPVVVDYSDIHQASFSRVGGVMASAKTFDLKVVQKSAGEVSFSSINKEEKDNIESYLKQKKVRVKDELADEMMIVDEVDDEDDDDDMQSIQSDEDAPRKAPVGSDDSEEDEDFHVSDSDGGSPSSATDDEEEDDAMSVASGDRDLVKSTKKAAAKNGKKDQPTKNGKKEPAKKRAKAKGSDGEEAAPKKKKQKTAE